MMNLKIAISSFFIALVFSMSAQDIHLTQANMTPLLVNPANAGAEYTMRGILNYRTQWGSVSEPYVTMMAAYDMNFKPASAIQKFGYFAGGIYVYNDEANNFQGFALYSRGADGLDGGDDLDGDIGYVPQKK